MAGAIVPGSDRTINERQQHSTAPVPLPEIVVARVFAGGQACAILPRSPGIPRESFWAARPHDHGGPRASAPGARSGDSDPVTTKCPLLQCGQTPHSMGADGGGWGQSQFDCSRKQFDSDPCCSSNGEKDVMAYALPKWANEQVQPLREALRWNDGLTRIFTQQPLGCALVAASLSVQTSLHVRPTVQHR